MLTNAQLDAFKELASIGAGHAATALSQLVDRKIVITCPELRIIPTAEVTDTLGGPEALVAAIYVRILGDARGGLLFVLDHESARALAGLLRGDAAVRALADSDHQLLRNAGAVLLAAFTNAMARTARIAFIPGTPGYAHDMFGGILETVVTETEGYAEEAILVDADFVEQEENMVRGRLFFLPAPGSLEAVVAAMGVD